ncbi:hypothetical protein B0H11DRAFT_372898 [Mycena galericulata]|nr:hypothetical protein B0H11DRAFT_372898 [Mycena galericulata]
MAPSPFDSPGLLSASPEPETQHRIAAIIGIFFVSLLAVSFPRVSQSSSFLRIPHVVFFIGKHFGTGMCYPFDGILSFAPGFLRASSESRRKSKVSQGWKTDGTYYPGLTPVDLSSRMCALLCRFHKI